MLERSSFDAVVVGARCAGAATAMLMARAGMQVLMIDRGAYGTDTLSTHALMRGGVLLLERWGVLDRIRAAGTPAVRSTSFHYGDEVLELAIKPSHGTDALFAPRRTVLDRALVDEAAAAGVTVRFGHTLTGLVRDLAGRVTGAAILDSSGAEHTVTANLVVGADGTGSAVARLAEARTLQTARHSTAVLYGHWRGLESEGYRWFYRPGVSAGVIPTNDRAHCVFAAASPARYRQELRHDWAAGFRQVIGEAAPQLAGAFAPQPERGRLWAFAGRRGFLRECAGPGWALVGDAGYFKDPITAHGITDALRDAALLAGAAQIGSARAFADYSRRRDALSGALFDATEAIASFAWDLPRLKALHADLNAAMKRETEFLAANTQTALERAA